MGVIKVVRAVVTAVGPALFACGVTQVVGVEGHALAGILIIPDEVHLITVRLEKPDSCVVRFSDVPTGVDWLARIMQDPANAPVEPSFRKLRLKVSPLQADLERLLSSAGVFSPHIVGPDCMLFDHVPGSLFSR